MVRSLFEESLFEESFQSKKSLLDEIIDSLRKPVKELPCKILYDQKGSQIFEEICKLPEYYLTRKETGILQDYIEEIVGCFPNDLDLIEYGSGSSRKTIILLDYLKDKLYSYIPVDISKENLLISSSRLCKDYPNVKIYPVNADYQEPFELPKTQSKNKVIYFSGSTIGNLHPNQAIDCLKQMKDICKNSGGLLIGLDLVKDTKILEKAYSDSQGITAQFSINALHRMNQEFNANFELDCFKYDSFYNCDQGRVEMYLVSLQKQSVCIGGYDIHFGDGERIWMESSYKYTQERFNQLALQADCKIEKYWTDSDQWFSLQYLKV